MGFSVFFVALLVMFQWFCRVFMEVIFNSWAFLKNPLRDYELYDVYFWGLLKQIQVG